MLPHPHLPYHDTATQIERSTHQPSVQDLLHKGQADFTALAREQGVDLDTALSKCTGCSIADCTAMTAADTQDAAGQAKVFDLHKTYFSQVRDNTTQSTIFSDNEQETAKEAATRYALVSNYCTNAEKLDPQR